MKLIFSSTFDCRERRILPFAMGQGYAIVLSYNQMKFKSNRKHFTNDLVKKCENNFPTHNLLKTNILYPHPLALVVLTLRTFKDFEEPLRVLTMYQGIPKTFTQANIPHSNQYFETFLAYHF